MSREVEDYKIPRFNGRHGDNFSLWSGRVEMALRAKGLYVCVEHEETPSPSEQTTDEALRKDKAAALIVAALGDKPLQCVISDLHNPARM